MRKYNSTKHCIINLHKLSRSKSKFRNAIWQAHARRVQAEIANTTPAFRLAPWPPYQAERFEFRLGNRWPRKRWTRPPTSTGGNIRPGELIRDTRLRRTQTKGHFGTRAPLINQQLSSPQCSDSLCAGQKGAVTKNPRRVKTRRSFATLVHHSLAPWESERVKKSRRSGNRRGPTRKQLSKPRDKHTGG